MSTIDTPLDASRLRKMIAAELPSLIDIRHDLHAHPELGYQEHRTCEVVKRELASSAIEHKGDLAGGTGVLGYLPGKSPEAVGLRADMDALPIEEKTGLPYASTSPGVMHACGHDGHTTILIGAARVLAQLSRTHPLPRPVTFVFQPAEEGGGGAKKMVDDGCLSGSILGPRVEHMFGLHGWPLSSLGRVGTRVGPLLAATDAFEISIQGVGAHAAFPQLGRDPIVAGSALVTALQSIVSRNTNPLDSVVLSITQFHAGTAFNVIPGTATLKGTIRTLTEETRATTQERLRETAAGISNSFGCKVEVTVHAGYPVTSNDPEAVEIFEREAAATLGAERIYPVETPVMGGEDFSFYGEVVPSCFFFLGLLPPGVTDIPKLHQDTFNFNDDAIATGIEVFCRLALRS